MNLMNDVNNGVCVEAKTARTQTMEKRAYIVHMVQNKSVKSKLLLFNKCVALCTLVFLHQSLGKFHWFWLINKIVKLD